MTMPYASAASDGEGTAIDSQTGKTYSYLAPWFVRGYTATLGPAGEFIYTPLIPSLPGGLQYAPFPPDQAYSMIRQYYFSGDGDPLGGYLTFMPSDDVTVTEGGTSWRMPRRLAGSETWPAVDTGISPWAFSMEGSGTIYIWRGYLAARLLATDNPNMVTDSGLPLTYHVTENFAGGRAFDITVPASSTDALDLTSLIIPGTVVAAPFDPVSPLNAVLEADLTQQVNAAGLGSQDPAVPLPVYTISVLTTNFIAVSVSMSDAFTGMGINPGSDSIDFAFMQGGTRPGSSDWQAGTWVPGGPPYKAQILIGPDNNALSLAAGQWQIWGRLTDYPQVITDLLGFLWVT